MPQDVLSPEPQYGPVLKAQLLLVLNVALHVAFYLLYPVGAVTTVLEAKLQPVPILSVEELAVAEDCYVVLRYRDVRLTGQSGIVLPVSVPVIPQRFPGHFLNG